MGFDVKTYIKIYGPPILEALKALEKVAVEISKELPEVAFYDFLGGTAVPLTDYAAEVLNVPLSEAQVHVQKLISKSGWTLGEYDFFFEWTRPPTFEELQKLIARIDEALKPLGCHYT
ncbi:MAG: hypothetical protein DRJ26_04385, partial [Candidatus Methanomethylicota archaeon]